MTANPGSPIQPVNPGDEPAQANLATGVGLTATTADDTTVGTPGLGALTGRVTAGRYRDTRRYDDA